MRQRRVLIVVGTVVQVVLLLWLAAVGWGGWRPLLAHPARATFVVWSVVLTGVALASPVNLSSGERENPAGRRALAPALLGFLVLAWLMPLTDRRDVWTVDGDVARWVGVAALVLGGALRVWPMFVLGRRFSGLVAIQPGHTLVTDGPYRYVRHPSYLGMLVAFAGWALVFRSGLGLAAVALGVPVLLQRIDAEEALLAAHFGSAYEDYRRRTWRLVPLLY